MFCFCLEALSEDDLLGQYSSFTKKTKKNSCGDSASSNSSEISVPNLDNGTAHGTDAHTPCRIRNKFAVFLQRKNEDSGAVVVPGTRSRYRVSRAPFKLDVAFPAGSCSMPVSLAALGLSYVTVVETKVSARKKSCDEGKVCFGSRSKSAVLHVCGKVSGAGGSWSVTLHLPSGRGR